MNPFDLLASGAGKIVADGWTAVMLTFWEVGLWFLEWAFKIIEWLTAPDITADGPARQLYSYTFWLALALMVLLATVQMGVAAWRRDGESLAQLLVGTGQFILIFVGWLAYAAAVLVAADGLTDSLMESLMDLDSWGAFQPWGDLTVEDVTDAVLATVLGVLGGFVILAAGGHLLVMLVRSAALLVLVATAPIAAAGFTVSWGKSWFWKSFRWFHAAAFTPVMIILVMGMGIQLTGGVVLGEADSLSTTVGTALTSVLLMLVGMFSPLVLFRLLAFVEPGTSSGAAMRAGYTSAGGLQGILSGSKTSETSSAASQTDSSGRSQSEVSSEAQTNEKTAQTSQSLLGAAGAALGPAGAVAGAAAGAMIGAVVKVGTQGAVIGADITNQMGVGSANYVPDYSYRGGGRTPGNRPEGRDSDGNPIGDEGSPPHDPPNDGGSDVPTRPPMMPPNSNAPTASNSPGAVPADAAGAGTGAGAGAGAGAAPIVPV